MRGDAPRSRARRIPLLALALTALAALAVALAPAIAGRRTSGPTAADANRTSRQEGVPYVGWLGNHHPTRRDLAADRRRLVRCANAAYRAAHRALCPSAAAYRGLPPALRRQAEHVQVQAALASEQGAWGNVFTIPSLGINAILMPTGKVLWFAYPNSDKSQNTATAWVWDPNTGHVRQVNPPNGPDGVPANIWCAGATLLPDGRVVVAGGNLKYFLGGLQGAFKGLDKLYTFNPWNETWTEQPHMRHGRWYPTLTAMPDGRVMIVGGLSDEGDDTTSVNNPDIEVFTPSKDLNGVGTLQLVQSGPQYEFSLYPHVFAAPDNTLRVTGPDAAENEVIDPAKGFVRQSGPWLRPYRDPDGNPGTPNGSRREWGAAVLMPPLAPGGPSKVMMIGGSPTNWPLNDGSATETTLVFDLNGNKDAGTPGPSMRTARSHLDAVLLPDGGILAMGGGLGERDGSLYVDPRYDNELLPRGGSAWQPMASAAIPRAYHSNGLLLPNGQLLAQEDDRPQADTTDGFPNNSQGRAQLFSPPYLFKGGTRPMITGAPAQVQNEVPFRVQVDQPDAVRRAVLIAPGAVTHANDMHQRLLELKVDHDAAGLQLTLPAGPTSGLPGYYMLFVLNGQGVPSEARWVHLSPSAADPQPAVPAGTVAPGTPPPPVATTTTPAPAAVIPPTPARPPAAAEVAAQRAQALRRVTRPCTGLKGARLAACAKRCPRVRAVAARMGTGRVVCPRPAAVRCRTVRRTVNGRVRAVRVCTRPAAVRCRTVRRTVNGRVRAVRVCTRLRQPPARVVARRPSR